MTALHDRVRAENTAWWDAHQDFDRLVPNAGTAESFAFSVVHWFHNAESSERHGTQTGDGTGLMAPVDRRTCRGYAIFATRRWLHESQRDLDLYPAGHAHWDSPSRGRLDVESLVRNLQIALDDFDWNDASERAARETK